MFNVQRSLSDSLEIVIPIKNRTSTYFLIIKKMCCKYQMETQLITLALFTLNLKTSSQYS